MPIYEYRCNDCGERVEVLLHSRKTAPPCPHCGSLLLERLFSVPHVVRGAAGRAKGQTCCGQEERCARPPCSEGDACRR
jgi:putative FmdB family regulatory protein